MARQTQIGLDTAKSKKLADSMNVLLANYQVFYINVRGFHWNITVKNFLNCTPSLKNSIMIF